MTLIFWRKTASRHPEANPQFHQQMCYAVAMRTIDHFERALRRKVLWSTRYLYDSAGAVIGHEFVPRLRIYPHAFQHG